MRKCFGLNEKKWSPQLWGHQTVLEVAEKWNLTCSRATWNLKFCTFFFFLFFWATPFALRLLNPWVCYWVNIFNTSEATVRPWQTERLRSQPAALQSSLGTRLSVYFSRSWSPCNQQRIGFKGPLWNRSVAAHILPSPWIWEVRTRISRRAG